MRRAIGLAVPAFLLIAAACSSESAESTTTTSTPSTTTTSTTSTTLPAVDVDRLVVVTDDGVVTTMDRDGSDEMVVSAEDEIPFQPIWSPDAQSIAYSSRASNEFVVADARGGGELRVEMDAAPFYFYWSPAGDELASLRNRATGGIVHERFQVGDALTVAEVEGGAPYYFAWSPDGGEIVAHIGTERLDLLTADGATDSLGVTPGAFQAPQWTEQGIVAPVLAEGGQRIVRIEDEEFETLAEVSGSVFFEVSATGRYLAVQSFDPDAADSVSVALVDEPVTPNRLQVVDLETGEQVYVLDGPALGFFWSPAVDRLLALEPAGDGGSLAITIWDDGEVIEGPEFGASAQWLAEFIPFYDQYARSMSLWAPDGSAYAFIGTFEGERGVFVADVASGAVKGIAEGTWVAWSPR